MTGGRLWLGVSGAEILLDPYGRSFFEKDIAIKREGRTASGKLVADVVATKKAFSVAWEKMPESTMDELLALYALGEDLSFLVERADTTIDSFTVRFQPFGRKRFLSRAEYALWDGEAVVLDEV
jgi:hypothetical protein